MSKAIFCYGYIPDPSWRPKDGGFCVNFYDDDTLAFTCFDTRANPVSEVRFALPPAIKVAFYACIAPAGWMKNMYPIMRLGEGMRPRYASRIGIDGYPLFLIEDFDELMNCPFRSGRGHYARMMYNLLEDIATVFSQAGLDLTPVSFFWDENRIRPIEPMTTSRKYRDRA